MKKIVLITICSFFLQLNAQPPLRFYTTFGGSGIDIGYSVKETYNRQYIIIGSTTSFGAGGSDAYMILTDSMGQEVWHKTFGGSMNDVGKSIVINPPDSGFVFTGYTGSFGNGGYDVYVVRTDKAGNIKWQSSFGGFDWDFGTGLVLSADGNILVCGSSYSGGHGKQDGIVMKFNINTGALMWQKYYGGGEDDEFRAIHTRNGSDFYVVGTTKSYGETNGDMYLFKLNVSGDSLLRIVYGDSLYDVANSVYVLDNNDIVLAGGSRSYTTTKRMAAIFIKFSPTGAFKWRRVHGLSPGDEEVYKVIASGCPAMGETVCIYTVKVPSNGLDIQTVDLSTNGDYYGQQNDDSGKFGWGNDDEAYDISPSKDKGYIQTGYTTSLNSLDKDLLLIKQDSLMEEDYQVVGIEENSLPEREFYAYPNPVVNNQDLIISFRNNKLTPEMISIVSVDGKQIPVSISETGVDNRIVLSTIKWEKGIYILNIKTGKFVYRCKVVKQ
jgi:hypothetical protein